MLVGFENKPVPAGFELMSDVLRLPHVLFCSQESKGWLDHCHPSCFIQTH